MEKIKVITIEITNGKYVYGAGRWTEDIIVYVNKFRNEDGMVIANLDTKTDESYINRFGRKCYRHRNCGTIRLTREKCIINIDVNGEEELICTPKDFIEKGKRYILLDFNK